MCADLASLRSLPQISIRGLRLQFRGAHPGSFRQARWNTEHVLQAPRDEDHVLFPTKRLLVLLSGIMHAQP